MDRVVGTDRQEPPKVLEWAVSQATWRCCQVYTTCTQDAVRNTLIKHRGHGQEMCVGCLGNAQAGLSARRSWALRAVLREPLKAPCSAPVDGFKGPTTMLPNLLKENLGYDVAEVISLAGLLSLRERGSRGPDFAHPAASCVRGGARKPRLIFRDRFL